MTTLKNLTAGGLLIGLATPVTAAITWQPSVNLYQGATVETFVSTNGIPLVAYNNTNVANGGANTTVNGVTFQAGTTGVPVFGAGGEGIVINGGTDNLGAFGDGEFTSNTPIFDLLRAGTFNVNSITLGGLTVGVVYEIQVFNNDARGSRSANFITGYGDGTGSTAPVAFSDLNNSPVDGTPPTFPETDAGDSIIGTFTAASSVLTFNIYGTNGGSGGTFSSGNSQSQINGIQLREIPVPEPSSSLLIGLAGASLLLRRRK